MVLHGKGLASCSEDPGTELATLVTSCFIPIAVAITRDLLQLLHLNGINLYRLSKGMHLVCSRVTWANCPGIC